MKKILLFTAATLLSAGTFAQGQIGNGDMESWANSDEPDNWNSFLTASGTWSGAASDQCDPSPDTRPGSTGTQSCRIFSKSTFGIVANGNLTLGKINMGSTTPSSPNNYNFTETADSDHSETLTDQPDSIVFWAKFTPNGGGGNARMKATLHTDYDYRDPEDSGSSAEVVATAVQNFPNTQGQWIRFAVPFDYSGPASVNEYILVTFTTNETPGGGDDNDQLWIDDVELVYNPTSSIDEQSKNDIVVSMNPAGNIMIDGVENNTGTYVIHNAMGQIVQSGEVAKEVAFEANTGVYFVTIEAEGVAYRFEVLKH